jgi:hypothetical protein
MLRKGDNFLKEGPKKQRHSEAQRPFNPNNKENLNARSLHDQDDNNQLRAKGAEQSNFGSVIVSPTFQSNNVISLKDDLFKQSKGYMEVNLSLKDINKKSNELTDNKNFNFQKKIEEAHLKEHLNLEEGDKKRLISHYQNKKYWPKI